MFWELGGLLLILVSFAIFGSILLSICSKKNQEITKRIYSDVIIGMAAGAVVALLSSFEGLTDNWFTLIFGCFVLIGMSLFMIGVMAFIIVYIIEGKIR